jgi:DNA-binding protein HU-beta
MRVYIIGNDGITLCRTAPATVNDGEIGLGVFNVAARPAREGRNPQTGESIEIAASKAVRFHAGKAVKDALNPPAPKAAPRKKSAPPKKSAVRK